MDAIEGATREDGEAHAARLRALPSITSVLTTDAAAELIRRYGRVIATESFRAAIENARMSIKAGASTPTLQELACDALVRADAQDRSSLRPIFNLTGTILHTNLGRAALAEAAIAAAIAAMREPVALEFNLSTGKRGERDDHVRTLLCDLTGAEDATVVNNNAAAVMLCLNTFALGREAIVSRGELIEIGGAFRMPSIMERAGTKMVEVGTTNRTHASDFQSALNAATGVILKVHTSNYRIQGFTAEVGAEELAAIAREFGVPLLHDLGSGTLIDLSRWGLPKEPTVRDAVAQGAGLVTFSGDKLLGGPQAGFIVGQKALITAINRNPMKRAFRVDKIRIAAIEATLKLYRDPDRLADRLPTLRSLTRPKTEIAAQALRLQPVLTKSLGPDYTVDPCDCESQIGSGALPLETIPSAGLVVRSNACSGALNRLAVALRGLSRPIIGRTADAGLILDLRCLSDEAEFSSIVSELSADALSSDMTDKLSQ